MSKVKELKVPPFYKTANAKDSKYVPDVQNLQKSALDWGYQNGLNNVGGDKVKVHLLVIDPQIDFSYPDGCLFVGGRSGTGAVDDHDRLARFIYKYLSIISEMTCTMDTHLIYQIFHPIAHLLQDGSHPDPSTIIPAEEYKLGKYHANPAFAHQLGVNQVWLQKQFIYYCNELEKPGPTGAKKYELMIWPYHTLLGGNGHRLVGIIQEARLFHSMARGASNIPEIKGGNPLTEHYSIFKPEVMTTWDGNPIPGAQKNVKLIETLFKSDVVIITGQAKSHCLAWTIQDFLDEILAVDKNLAKKVYLLEDCTSSVVIPGIIDFTPNGDAAFQKFADAGMNLVKSTIPIEDWPGMAQKLNI